VNEENLNNLNIVDTHPFKTTIIFYENPMVDDIHVIWENHDEEIYI